MNLAQMDYNPTKGGRAVQPKVDLFETKKTWRNGERVFLPPTLVHKYGCVLIILRWLLIAFNNQHLFSSVLVRKEEVAIEGIESSES